MFFTDKDTLDAINEENKKLIDKQIKEKKRVSKDISQSKGKLEIAKERFKENWNKKDEVCSHCGQVTNVARGLNKQNLKNLFKKPTIEDLMILIMLILIMVVAYAYNNDISRCQETIKNPQELCTAYYQSINKGNFGVDVSISTDENGNLIIVNKTNNYEK